MENVYIPIIKGSKIPDLAKGELTEVFDGRFTPAIKSHGRRGIVGGRNNVYIIDFDYDSHAAFNDVMLDEVVQELIMYEGLINTSPSSHAR